MDTKEILKRAWKQHQSGDVAGAEQEYRKVLQQEPDHVQAWFYMGIAHCDQGRLDESVAAYHQVIRLRPNHYAAFTNLGNTLLHLNRLDDAVACMGQSIKLKPDSASSHTNLGLVLLLRGLFAQGWEEYKWRWQTDGVKLPKLDRPRWDGSPLDGKTILLTHEQGLGDTVQFARYAAYLQDRYDCRVLLSCQKGLLPLLRTCGGVDQLLDSKKAPPDFDVFAPLLDLPGLLRQGLEDFPAATPYLSADAGLVQRWREVLADYQGFKVGLVWQGNPKHKSDGKRSIELRQFAPLGQLEGVRFFSLQKGAGSDQLETLAGCLDVVHWGRRIDGKGGAFMDTAAILKNLDLLITVDTAVAHVAGALQVPTWLALAKIPDWRWGLEGRSTVWYPSLRLFRQSEAGDWSAVLAQMAQALQKQAPNIRPKAPDRYRLATSGYNRLGRGRHGLMLYNRNDQDIGRSLDRYGEFSQGEVELFRQVVQPGQTVVEVGANIGAHTLVFSQLVDPTGKVYAFEPQRLVFQSLCANMALNSRTNVHCIQAAVGPAPGQVLVPVLDCEAENNFGGLSVEGHPSGEKVQLVTIDGMDLPQCALVKVDVEGMELKVLRGAVETIDKFKPVLYVENDRGEHSPALIQWLQERDYLMYWHCPPLFNAANYYGNKKNAFGHTVSVNMLCLHRSVKTNITGLRQVEGPHSDWRAQ